MFKKKKPQHAGIGMVITERGISVVSADTDEQKSEYKHFAADDWSGITQWVQQHQLVNKQVHLVLDNKQYKLSQVEPPLVPQEELNSALLYSMRDRLDYKMNEVQIDNFSYPEDAHRGDQKKVNVVTSHSPMLKGFIQSMEKSGLTPAVIDIAELAVRNILLEKQSMAKGICFLAYHENFVSFYIYRNAELYLTRSVVINSWEDCISADIDFAKEGLLLEIQRTLDYYQSQLGQPPVAELVVPDWSQPLSPLIDYLTNNLDLDVSKISFRGEDQALADSDELRQLMLAKAGLIESELKLETNHAEG